MAGNHTLYSQLLLFIISLAILALWYCNGTSRQTPQASKEVHTRVDCPFAPQSPQDRRRNRQRLRLVTFNAEWLFLSGGHGGHQCPGEGCTWKSQRSAQQHLARVARILRQLDGDIVNLIEIEDCRVLHELIGEIGDADLRPFMIRSTDRALGQNVGLLTRVDPVSDLTRINSQVSFPIPHSGCPRGEAGQTSLSKHYLTRVHLHQINQTVSIIGLHLLARPQSASRCAKREAQAFLLLSLIKSVSKSEPLIVMGDFNDYDASVTGKNLQKPISPVLKMIKRHYGLRNVAQRIPLARRYSAWWDVNGNCRDDGGREHVLIDHVLVSKGLAERVKRVFVGHGMFGATCREFERVSDHWPLVVDFEWK